MYSWGWGTAGGCKGLGGRVVGKAKIAIIISHVLFESSSLEFDKSNPNIICKILISLFL